MKHFDYMDLDAPCGNTRVNVEKDLKIQGYVVVNKITGERWGSCFDSTGGAKTSWHGEFVRSTGYPSRGMQHLKGIKFDDQDEYAIKPLIILDT